MLSDRSHPWANRIFAAIPTRVMDLVEFQVEVPIQASKGSIFSRLNNPSGLSEWFADDVNIKKDVFTFFWDGSEESARLISQKREEFVKYRWMEHEEEGAKSFFEMSIKIDPLTGDTALVVTDFAEEDEVEEAKLLWTKQLGRPQAGPWAAEF